MVKKDVFGRRTVLSGLSAAAIAGIAGCMGADAQSNDGAGQSDGDGNQGQGPPENPEVGEHSTIRLERVGGYSAGVYDDGGAEIVSYDSATEQAFVANSAAGAVDILDISDPAAPTKVDNIDIAAATNWAEAAEVTSVDVQDGLIAAGVANQTKTDDGRVVVASTETLEVVGSETAGPLPDSVAFTPDSSAVLVANEGEPDEAFETVPEGSVSVVSLNDDGSPAESRTAGFTEFNGQEDELREQGVRIFGPEDALDVASNVEPETVTVGPDGSTAWVTLQEANAFAVVDIESASVTEIQALGYKDHMLPGNGFDASDSDGGPNIRNWPTKGMYHPDGIDTYEVGEETFVVSANEGDARDFDGYSEETEVSELDLDEEAFDFDQIAGIETVEQLQAENTLGELETTTANGDIDGDGQHEEIYSYGARSFSIWDDQGNLVFDSGDEFERITAERYPDNFNNDNDESDPDGRSDAKGPEPEGVSIGRIGDRAYAFISFERMSGVIVYDITVPESATFVQYINPRDFSVDIESEIIEGNLPADAAGDVGTEDVEFIPHSESPVDTPLLLTANEASGTTGVFQISLIE
ncbi:choice-of-anchor I family protein [Halobacteriaceae bacterium SHR40]|uniref:choice-of-anchor I family protein n=1 Tax=Halovenus amylolytica TaxID=2500550 RepID=UPI000FE41699